MIMCSDKDKDGVPQKPAEEACAEVSPPARNHSARVCEYLPALQRCHFTRAIAGPEHAEVIPSHSDLGGLFLKDFPWAKVQTSLLFLLGLLLLGALGFIWKLLWEKERECRTKERLQRELSWRKAQEVHVWRKARSYAVSVTLDPDTAHRELFLSEDHRSVRRKASQQNLPKIPGRFFLDPCVLGREAFSSGRCYWEVEAGDRTYWELGVCEENMERTWAIKESPQHGVWSLERYVDKCHALTSPRTLLPLSEPPSRVGIFLDYEAGEVSFFSVPDGSHIYTFSQASFSGCLRPFFCLWFDDPTPLSICY